MRVFLAKPSPLLSQYQIVFLLWKNQEVLDPLFHETERRETVRRRGGKRHLGTFRHDEADSCAIAARAGQYFFETRFLFWFSWGTWQSQLDAGRYFSDVLCLSAEEFIASTFQNRGVQGPSVLSVLVEVGTAHGGCLIHG